MRKALAVALLLIDVLGISGCRHQESTPAETVLIHARIYTVNTKEPWAQAVALRGGEIIAVGSDKAIAA